MRTHLRSRHLLAAALIALAAGCSTAERSDPATAPQTTPQTTPKPSAKTPTAKPNPAAATAKAPTPAPAKTAEPVVPLVTKLTGDDVSSEPPVAASPEAAEDEVAVNVKVDEGQVVNEADAYYHGNNFCALWNNTGNSEPTKLAYKRLGIGLLRFPGGVPAEWYDWEKPLDTGWTKITPDDAWSLAKQDGGALMFQTNSAGPESKNKAGVKFKFDNSGAHAAAWVRAAQDAGMKVAWWEIGNEPEMDSPAKGSQDKVMAWYNGIYEEQARAIRKDFPEARILGYSGTNTYFWWHERNMERFMAAHGDKGGTGLADGISIHWYAESGDAPWNKMRGTAQGWASCMDYLRACVAHYDSRDLPILITEWNVGGGMQSASTRTLKVGLANADAVGMFLRTGVAGHTYFCLQSGRTGWGMMEMAGQDKPEAWVAPTGFSLSLAGRLVGKVLATTNDADEGNVLSAYAVEDGARTLRVMLINKGEKQAAVHLSFAALAAKGKKATIHRLEGAKPDPNVDTVVLNGVSDPQPAKRALPAPEAVTLDEAPIVRLRPCSLALIEIADAAPITAPVTKKKITEEQIKKLGIGGIKPPKPRGKVERVPVAHAKGPITIDGDAADWAGISPTREPFMKDKTSSVTLCWGDEGLYGLVRATDKSIESDANQPWTKDSIELFVDKSGAGRAVDETDCAQYTFFPNAKAEDGAGGVKLAYASPADKDHAPTCKWKKTDDGYVLEFLIPAAALAPAKLAAGSVIGLNFALSDDGKPVEQFFSDKNVDQGWANPASWGEITLAQ